MRQAGTVLFGLLILLLAAVAWLWLRKASIRRCVIVQCLTPGWRNSGKKPAQEDRRKGIGIKMARLE